MRHRALLTAGGAPPFDPLTLSPVLWYDYSDTATITSSGGLVSQVNDKSTSARHATASGTERPTTAATTRNGLNVLTFDGAARLSFTAIWLGGGTGCSAYAVASKAAVTNKNVILAGISSGDLYLAAGGSSSSAAPFCRRDGSGASTAPASLATGAWGVISSIDTGGTTSALRCGLNGSYGTAATAGGSATKWDRHGFYPVAADFNFQGNIGELLIFSSALSSPNDAAVVAYLRAKWGI